MQPLLHNTLSMRIKIVSILITVLTFALSLQSNAFPGDENGEKGEKTPPGTKKTMAQPDVPGALVIEIANNILQNYPATMKLNWTGSWSANIYYMYEFPIGTSNFSLNLGLGLGLEKYSFDNNITLVTSSDDSQTTIEPLENVLPSADKYKKSVFANNYVDFPLEIRFFADKNNRRKSFKVAAGGKFGVRYDIHTKLKYEENDRVKKLKNYENYNVPNFRYGVYGRLGIAGVSLYYYYSLTEMFDNKKGPEETRASVMMVGLSLSGF